MHVLLIFESPWWGARCRTGMQSLHSTVEIFGETARDGGIGGTSRL